MSLAVYWPTATSSDRVAVYKVQPPQLALPSTLGPDLPVMCAHEQPIRRQNTPPFQTSTVTGGGGPPSAVMHCSLLPAPCSRSRIAHNPRHAFPWYQPSQPPPHLVCSCKQITLCSISEPFFRLRSLPLPHLLLLLLLLLLMFKDVQWAFR